MRQWMRGWLGAAAVVAMGILSGGCWPFGSDEPEDTRIPKDIIWTGPEYEKFRPLPAETALLIASHRQKGSEVNYDAMLTSKVEASDGRIIEEARAIQVSEKVLYQGRTLPNQPNSPAISPFPLDMTEIREADLKRYIKTELPNGNISIDTVPTAGAVSFGKNSIDIMGYTTLPMDTRRCPIATIPGGPDNEPNPFNIRGGLVHYLLPHFPPASGGTGGGFRAGGTWKTRVPVFYPLSGLDPNMFEACRFMLFVDHQLEGFRQGPDCVLARIHYTYTGGFDSRDPEMAKRFPPDWGKYHVILDRMTGSGTMVVDVGRGEVIWRKETTKFEIKEQHFMPPDPNRPNPEVDTQGKWEPSSKVITDEFKLYKRYPVSPQPPEMPPMN